MKCNDCIYEKMCESRYEREHCLSFKDKANFVEVVRCKDCAYCRYVDDVDIYKCDRRGFYSEEVMPTDYCSLGERREENER